MPYNKVMNHETVKHKCPTQMYMIVEMACSSGAMDSKNHCSKCIIMKLKISHRPMHTSELLSRSPTILYRGPSWCKIWVSHMSNFVVSWIPFHNSRFFQEHLTMLQNYLWVLYLAFWGLGSIWNGLGLMWRLNGVFERCAYGVGTTLHFGDVLWFHDCVN